MRVTGFGSTDVGKRRERNEDRLLVDQIRGLYVVADGMGGHAHGDLAATVAVDTVSRTVKRFLTAADTREPGVVSGDVLQFIVREAVNAAAREVHRIASAADGAIGMGCTLTILLTRGRIAAMAHVGDSRLYRLRGDEVEQLSQDHTLAADLARAGLIPESAVANHRTSHVLTRAIGTCPTVDVDTALFELLPGDRFLLCSDGLSPSIEDQDWLTVTLGSDSPARAVERFIARANAVDGGDNITAIVAEVSLDTDRTWPETRPLVLEESSSENTPYHS